MATPFSPITSASWTATVPPSTEPRSRYRLQWTMLPPRYDKLIARLDSDPAWQRIYADRNAVIHRRR